MNERILELAKQAGLKFPSEEALSPVEIKFAQLIVEECANRAEVYAYMSPNFNALAEELRKMIGVEE